MNLLYSRQFRISYKYFDSGNLIQGTVRKYFLIEIVTSLKKAKDRGVLYKPLQYLSLFLMFQITIHQLLFLIEKEIIARIIQ